MSLDKPVEFYSSKPRVIHMAFNIALAPVLLYLIGVWPWPPTLPHYITFLITGLIGMRYARQRLGQARSLEQAAQTPCAAGHRREGPAPAHRVGPARLRGQPSTPDRLEGERQGDAWSYTWQRNGQDWRASITPTNGTVQLSLQRNDQDPVSTVLTRQTIVSDEAITLAPRISIADWQHWFDVVLTGHFSTADVPDCG